MSNGWVSAVLLAVATFAGTLSTSAHDRGRSYCTVTTVPGGIDVSIETPVEHLLGSLGLGARAASGAELADAETRVGRDLEARVVAGTPNGRCRVESEPPKFVDRGSPSLSVNLHFFCPEGPITLKNSWRLDVDPGSEIVCAIDGSGWVFGAGREEREVGTPQTVARVLGSFLRSGADHVVTGLDHVLFVATLLLAAAHATRDLKLWSGLWSVAGIVTGFTLGHSITLIMAGLGLIALNSRFTECVIALSIVVVALQNIFQERPRARVLTATAFGLIHGFGFAAVLAETELPRRATTWALLAFNVGIELAQLAIVAVLFPLLRLLARHTRYRAWVLVPASALVAVIGSIWSFKRATGANFLAWLGS